MTTEPSSIAPLIDSLRTANAGLRREVLDNGLTVLVKEDRSAPVVAVQIWVGTGSIHEGDQLGAGLSHYMEHMIFKGTPTRGPADITREIDEAGGEINAYTAHDRTVFYADLPSRNWKVGVDVLSDAVMNASLPADEWEREKQVILREFAMGYDSPPRVHGKLLYETAYRRHPYRVPVIGYEDVFQTMTRDHLDAFFHQHYVPDNMFVVVVGAVDPDEVIAHLRTTFANFNRRARAPIVLPAEPAALAPRTGRVTGNYQVSRLHWAYHTVSVDHPDAPALDVLAAVLGDGRSSLFYRRLREELQLVHSINVWSHTPADGGLFGFSAHFDPDREQEVIDAINTLIREVETRPFTATEIERARRQYIVSELHSLQTMSGQASSFGAGEYYAGDPRFSERYLESIARVDDADLHRVFARYVVNGHPAIALLTPASAAPEAALQAADTPDAGATRLELPNGLRVIVRTDRRLPFVYLSAVMRGGLLSENADNNGITQLTADLLTRGTAQRTAAELADAIETRGASLSGFAGRNSFGLNASGLTTDAAFLMEALAECLTQPTFPASELDKQRRQQLASLRQQSEQPMFLAQEALRGLLFPAHPYRFNTLGSDTSLAALDRDTVAAYYQRHARPDNLVISVFGDIDATEAEHLVAQHLGALSGQADLVAHIEPAETPTLPARAETAGPFEQAILLVGYPGIDVTDPRNEALNILQRAMSGLSSDLAIEIREKRGLVYFIGAMGMAGLDPGLFAFYAGTTAEAIDEVETEVAAQVTRLIESGLRPEEFERARAQLLAGHDMSLQNTGELAQLCALHELYGLSYAYPLQTPERLAALTVDDIRAAAASLFAPTGPAISRLLPESP
jgi:zinc protease